MVMEKISDWWNHSIADDVHSYLRLKELSIPSIQVSSICCHTKRVAWEVPVFTVFQQPSCSVIDIHKLKYLSGTVTSVGHKALPGGLAGCDMREVQTVFHCQTFGHQTVGRIHGPVRHSTSTPQTHDHRLSLGGMYELLIP